MYLENWQEVESKNGEVTAVWQISNLGVSQQAISIPRCVEEQLDNYRDYLLSMHANSDILFLGFATR